jgi:1-acyl-sn-glycerol-3-phosphate acyltransferase
MKDIWFGYWFKNWFLTYKVGYLIVISGIRGYFRNHEYRGKNKIPKDAGVIYAVNHQNAFLDPIVIAGRTRQPTHFLTRADIFKKPFVAKILSQLYMLPIYRQRDGANTLKMNEKTFNQCYDILSNNGQLIIFPEGNHHYKKSLRSFKKGIARIALGTAEKNNYEIPLYIVPLGIDYGNHFNMNSDLLLNAGDPISVSEYFKNHQKEPAETINKLSAKVYQKLETLVLNIKDLDNYDAIYYLVHKIPLKKKFKSISERFDQRQIRLNKIELLQENNPSKYNELIEKSILLKEFCGKNKIKPYLFTKNLSSAVLSFYSLLMVIFLPLHLIGLTTNYVPYKIPVVLINKKIKDKHFHGSLKYAFGVVLFYLYWIAIFISLIVWKGWVFASLAAISFPIVAFLNLKYWISFVKLRGSWRYIFVKKSNSFSTTEKDLKEILSLIN